MTHLQNLDSITKLLNNYSWEELAQLRLEAIARGTRGDGVREFTDKVLRIVGDGLDTEEQNLLSYAYYSIEYGSPAERAIKLYRSGTSIEKLIKQRGVDNPYE